jgi:hypothetical protein
MAKDVQQKRRWKRGLKESEQENRAELSRFRAERKMKALKGQAGLERRRSERGGSGEFYWTGKMMDRKIERETSMRASEVQA